MHPERPEAKMLVRKKVELDRKQRQVTFPNTCLSGYYPWFNVLQLYLPFVAQDMHTPDKKAPLSIPMNCTLITAPLPLAKGHSVLFNQDQLKRLPLLAANAVSSL